MSVNEGEIRVYTVYAHRNLKNGKSYIGMTSLNPKRRWENGLSGYRNNQQMYNDIKSSDWNTDWVHEILGQFEDKDEALKYEAFLIAMLDTVRNGYNTSSYGSNSYKRTEKTRKKLSESRIGITFSEEHKKKISEALSGEKHPMFGKHHSEESKKKIRENNPSKAVIQLSKDGEFIAEYPSTKEAERQTGCHHQSICACCKGRLKTCGRYIWKYKKI